MARAKHVGLLSMCDRVGRTDLERLADLTARAKGNRSSAAFADECGLNPATISRIINAKFKKNLSDDVVAAIAVNAENADGTLFKEFLDAQGLVIPAAVNATPEQSVKLYTEYLNQVRLSWEMSRKTKVSPTVNPTTRKENQAVRVQETVQNALIRAGYSVGRVKTEEMLQNGETSFFADFILKTDALASEGLDKWAFVINEAVGSQFLFSISNIAAQAYFARPAQDGFRITVITTDWKTFYQARASLMRYREAYDSISVMLVNIRYGIVEAEYVLKRTVETAHVFPEGKSPDEVDWQEVYGIPDEVMEAADSDEAVWLGEDTNTDGDDGLD